MLHFFRNNELPTYFLVLFYTAIFALNVWVYPNTNLESVQDLPSTFNSYLTPWLLEPIYNKIAFILLLLIQAFYVNYLANEYKIARGQGLIVALTFVLLHFAFVEMDFCTPVMLGNLFLIFALHALFDSYDKKVSLGTVFNIGFWIAIASFFYSSNWVFIIWGLVALLIVRTFDLQEFGLIILGFLTPYFLAGTIAFITDSYSYWVENQFWVHLKNPHFTFEWSSLVGLGIFVIFFPLVLSLLNINGLQFKTTTKEKKYLNILFIMPFFGLLTFFFQNEINTYHLSLFIVPIGVLLGLVLQSYKNAFLAEAVHLLLFMICLGIQYQQFFFG